MSSQSAPGDVASRLAENGLVVLGPEVGDTQGASCRISLRVARGACSGPVVSHTKVRTVTATRRR